MAERNPDTYWASLPLLDVLPKLVAKKDAHEEYLRGSGLYDLYYRSHEMYQWGLINSRVNEVGKQGEFKKLVVNHYGNIGRHILTSTTSAQPDFAPRARNGDFRSRAEVQVCNGVLDYYVSEQHARVRQNEATELGLVCGESYLLTVWDPYAGPIGEIDDSGGAAPVGGSISPPQGAGVPGSAQVLSAPAPTSPPRPFDDVARLAGEATAQTPAAPPIMGRPIPAGDIRVSAPHPVDVIRDWTRGQWYGTTWAIVRERWNRYDLAAIYGTDPEKRRAILAVGIEDKDTWRTRQIRLLTNAKHDAERDDVYVYTFLHEPTPALPEGRIVRYLDATTSLEERPFPKRGPEGALEDGKLEDVLQRTAAAEIKGIPAGYTWMWDLMAICDAINLGHSTKLTNIAAYGTVNLTGPAGAEPFKERLGEGFNYIGVNGRSEGKIEVLDLVSVPPQLVEAIRDWEALVETLSGVNSVARGNPEASLKSGAALALVQSQFIEFTRAFQASYAHLWELLGTALVRLFQRNVPEARLAAIVGKGSRSYVKAVKGADIANIDRVAVEIAPHLARTAAGRRDLAETLLTTYGPQVIPPEEYIHVLNTGELDSRLHKASAQLDLIQLENEMLMDGGTPTVLITDLHPMHIKEHCEQMADPEIRTDELLVNAHLAHVQEHINAMQTIDPRLAAILGLPQMPPELAGGGMPPPGGPEAGTPGLPAGEGAGMPMAGEQIPLPAINPATGQPAQVRMPQPEDAGKGMAA